VARAIMGGVIIAATCSLGWKKSPVKN
jgi:hypothetical protein